MTPSHTLAPNVWKYYQDYFQSRPIHSYPSTSSLVYYYTKVLLSRNYFHWSFIEKTSVQKFHMQMYPPGTDISWSRPVLCKVIVTCWGMQLRMQMYPLVQPSGGQDQYYIRSPWHVEECNCECKCTPTMFCCCCYCWMLFLFLCDCGSTTTAEEEEQHYTVTTILT